jgi:hypothetical protein
MNDIPDTAWDRDILLENFAAELTSAVYPLVLRRGPKGLWVNVELGLWRALAETLQKWAQQQPAAASPDEFEVWLESLIVDLAESAFYIALQNGIIAALPEVELCLYRAVHQVTRS